MDDLLAGLSFLHEIRPTIYFHGNHENRAVGLAHSGNQVVAYAASNVMAKIHDGLAKYKTQIVPYKGMLRESVRHLGGTAFLHGALFNVSAARDTAETVGTHCVFGHTHRVAVEPARTHADAIGYNIGCLGPPRYGIRRRPSADAGMAARLRLRGVSARRHRLHGQSSSHSPRITACRYEVVTKFRPQKL
jgi:hypothetical protein